jgi:hypothetical protein
VAGSPRNTQRTELFPLHDVVDLDQRVFLRI